MGEGEAADWQLEVGQYRIGRLLGKGSTGCVKLGKHKTTDQLVALKMFDKSKMNAEERESLVHEMKIMRMLNHPNIVRLFEAIETTDHMYLVLEYCQLGEVFDYVVVHERLTEKEMRPYFRQMVSALDYCHARNVVHRDLKLENLLMSQDKQVKISDFGLGAVVANRNARLTAQCGTPSYAAPELLVTGSPGYNGFMVDIWSLGIVLYGTLHGFLPFDAPEVANLYQQIREEEVQFPRYGNAPQLSSEVIDLLRRMLCKDPARRISLDDIKVHGWVTAGGLGPIITERVSAPTMKKGKAPSEAHPMGNQRNQPIPAIVQPQLALGVLEEAAAILTAEQNLEKSGESPLDDSTASVGVKPAVTRDISNDTTGTVTANDSGNLAPRHGAVGALEETGESRESRDPLSEVNSDEESGDEGSDNGSVGINEDAPKASTRVPYQPQQSSSITDYAERSNDEFVLRPENSPLRLTVAETRPNSRRASPSVLPDIIDQIRRNGPASGGVRSIGDVRGRVAGGKQVRRHSTEQNNVAIFNSAPLIKRPPVAGSHSVHAPSPGAATPEAPSRRAVERVRRKSFAVPQAEPLKVNRLPPLESGSTPRQVRIATAASTTSSVPPAELRTRVEQVLTEKGISYQGQNWTLNCEDGAELNFEIEIVQLPNISLHGIRFKRIEGALMLYKKRCTDLIEAFNFHNLNAPAGAQPTTATPTIVAASAPASPPSTYRPHASVHVSSPKLNIRAAQPLSSGPSPGGSPQNSPRRSGPDPSGRGSMGGGAGAQPGSIGIPLARSNSRPRTPSGRPALPSLRESGDEET